MSKIIKMSEEFIEDALIDIRKALEGAKMSDGKFSFSKDFGNVDLRAKLTVTEKAYAKMSCLVHGCDSEVAWHGLAKRGENANEYVIYDIIVYPQEVSGVTVTTDQDKYQRWLMEHDDDVFNNIRMQGHSHVNMGVTPSSVDTALYDRLLDQLDDSMFYIFLILNKKGDKMIKIYDLRENTLFETKDVDFRVEVLSDWYSDAMSKLEKKVYQAPTTKPTSSYSQTPKSKGGGYYGKSKYDIDTFYNYDKYYGNNDYDD